MALSLLNQESPSKSYAHLPALWHLPRRTCHFRYEPLTSTERLVNLMSVLSLVETLPDVDKEIAKQKYIRMIDLAASTQTLAGHARQVSQLSTAILDQESQRLIIRCLKTLNLAQQKLISFSHDGQTS